MESLSFDSTTRKSQSKDHSACLMENSTAVSLRLEKDLTDRSARAAAEEADGKVSSTPERRISAETGVSVIDPQFTESTPKTPNLHQRRKTSNTKEKVLTVAELAESSPLSLFLFNQWRLSSHICLSIIPHFPARLS
jgi:hypothetical protein